MTSKKITLGKLNNTRDLFGMKTRDGRHIVPGKLLRSGHLFAASEADRAYLAEKVSLIVDFRTAAECREKPNPTISGAEYMHLPILKSLTAGITKEEAAVNTAVRDLSQDPEGAREYMMRMYRQFVADGFAVSQYAEFMKSLGMARKGAVLWHCTAGKDRAGFASALIQEVLGVSREDIFADYLLTNECLKEEVECLIAMVTKRHSEKALSQEALWLLFSAQEEYLAAMYREVQERYGNFETFVQRGLKLDQATQEHLRELYLE
ncbi:MAG: tyrosine-protein phosphatase [Lachnospiraceae bacterium]|nr:tyrosine-protein phosphatase [Lachnospiraceae bacterium]